MKQTQKNKKKSVESKNEEAVDDFILIQDKIADFVDTLKKDYTPYIVSSGLISFGAYITYLIIKDMSKLEEANKLIMQSVVGGMKVAFLERKESENE